MQNHHPRYIRHYALPEIGTAGQQKLASASVLVVGAGGLGCPCIQYLAAAGIGRLGILDDDVVEESNLQRQVIYTESDTGKLKAKAAEDYVNRQNRQVKTIVITERLTSENAAQLISGFDVIIDASDNFKTRYAVNDACVETGRPFVYGSVFRFEGQVSVFNHLKSGKQPLTYRDLYPSPPPAALSPDCAEAGVMGALTGIIGSIQAMEAIKIITGAGEALHGKLLVLDALHMQTSIMKLNAHPAEDQKAESGEKSEMPLREITPEELRQWRDDKTPHTLIDVREPHEHHLGNIGGILIPFNRYPDIPEIVDRSKPAVIYCRSGLRSLKAIRLLQQQFGLENLVQLSGGVLEWQRKIDPALRVN